LKFNFHIIVYYNKRLPYKNVQIFSLGLKIGHKFILSPPKEPACPVCRQAGGRQGRQACLTAGSDPSLKEKFIHNSKFI
jgi:hypothetical protein